jgi:CRP/FNR family cyclic AMP-dependent transcriptional regulator
MSASASNFDEPINFKKGQVIFAEGEASSYLYIVVSGEVRIFKEQSGKLMPITVVGPRDFIGELSMFNEESRSATAIATKDSTLMIIKKTDIRKVLRSCPEWVSDIMITISDRLRSTVEVLREHRIVDDLNPGENEQVSAQDLKAFQSSVASYRSRRGL